MSDGETAEENDLIPCHESVSLLGLTPEEFAAIAPSIKEAEVTAVWVNLKSDGDECRAVHSINPAISKDNYVLLTVPHGRHASDEYFTKVLQAIEEKFKGTAFPGEMYPGEAHRFKYSLPKKLTPPELADFVKIYGPLGNASINAYLNYVPVTVFEKWIFLGKKMHSNTLRQLARFGK